MSYFLIGSSRFKSFEPSLVFPYNLHCPRSTPKRLDNISWIIPTFSFSGTSNLRTGCSKNPGGSWTLMLTVFVVSPWVASFISFLFMLVFSLLGLTVTHLSGFFTNMRRCSRMAPWSPVSSWSSRSIFLRRELLSLTCRIMPATPSNYLFSCKGNKCSCVGSKINGATPLPTYHSRYLNFASSLA